jgi:hypothetical protein
LYGKGATWLRWAGYGRHVREEKWICGFEGRPKRPLGRHRYRWKNNIKIYVKKVE